METIMNFPLLQPADVQKKKKTREDNAKFWVIFF